MKNFQIILFSKKYILLILTHTLYIHLLWMGLQNIKKHGKTCSIIIRRIFTIPIRQVLLANGDCRTIELGVMFGYTQKIGTFVCLLNKQSWQKLVKRSCKK